MIFFCLLLMLVNQASTYQLKKPSYQQCALLKKRVNQIGSRCKGFSCVNFGEPSSPYTHPAARASEQLHSLAPVGKLNTKCSPMGWGILNSDLSPRVTDQAYHLNKSTCPSHRSFKVMITCLQMVLSWKNATRC